MMYFIAVVLFVCTEFIPGTLDIYRTNLFCVVDQNSDLHSHIGTRLKVTNFSVTRSPHFVMSLAC